MPAIARLAVVPEPQSEASQVAAFMRGFSLEATKPGAADVAALKSAVPARTPIYLSATPGHPAFGLIEQARRLRTAGFEPVPHLAARNITNAAMLEDSLSGLSTVASVRRVLVIAGDPDRAAGPFASAIDLIESGLLQRHGIEEIGIAGYPDGHPRISPQVLERALSAKVEAAEQTGLKVHIVTQFCFKPCTVLAWITRLRDRGFEHPVRIGMAGPTSLSTLLRYAQRCGVRASVLGLTRNAGLLKHLVGISAPDALIRPLAEAAATGRLGRVMPHFFSFGGIAATGRWAAAVKAGNIDLDRADGFRVRPQ